MPARFKVLDAQALLDESGWTKSECAREAGLSAKTVSAVVNGNGVSRPTCTKFLKALREKGNVDVATNDKIVDA